MIRNLFLAAALVAVAAPAFAADMASTTEVKTEAPAAATSETKVKTVKHHVAKKAPAKKAEAKTETTSETTVK